MSTEQASRLAIAAGMAGTNLVEPPPAAPIDLASPMTMAAAMALAKQYRAEGRHEEAEAMMEAQERRLNDAALLLARQSHKALRSKQAKERAPHIDPEVDRDDPKSFGACKTFQDFFAKAVHYAHLDQGPAPEGEVSTGARLFARMTPETIEAKFIARMNMVHHWEARAWNAYEWSRMVAQHGLAKARAMKGTVKWIPLLRYDHLEAIGNGTVVENLPFAEPVVNRDATESATEATDTAPTLQAEPERAGPTDTAVTADAAAAAPTGTESNGTGSPSLDELLT
ncbi:MAG: hypothetical protein ACLQVI_35915 [Polyangiaceae bacterium]